MISTGVDALDQDKLSKGDLVDLNFENVNELGLTGLVFILILKPDLSIVVELTGKFEMVVLLDFDVVAGSQGMDISFKAVFIFHNSSSPVSERKQINTIFGDFHELICRQKEPFDLGLPELVALMPVLDLLAF